MKQIIEIKMVEQKTVRFVANDGKEFIGENAEHECATYERRLDTEKVKKAFERLDIKPIQMPFIEFWYGDYGRMWQVTLNNKQEYYALVDYMIQEEGICTSEMYVKEPKEYPYTTLIASGCEWLYVYKDPDEFIKELQDVISQLTNKKEGI